MLDALKYIYSKGIKFVLLRPSFRGCSIQKSSKVNLNSLLVNVTMGKYSYIGYDCSVTNAKIGSFCSISNNCVIGAPSHPVNWVSTSPVFIRGRNILGKNFSTHEFENNETTCIGNDVWIGTNCLIRSGITIGDGAIIGMGSVVTKDVPPYEIWAGNPAKLIKKRFDDDTIHDLLNIEWWYWSDNKISEEAMRFNDTRLFLIGHTD
jgi:acetyltransferase-like isoleucine patch superfamily enzyme